MYEIIIGGAVVALTAKPRYIKINPDTGVFVEATAEDAIGVAVAGAPYNLHGGTAIEGMPEADIREADASEYIFDNSVQIKRNAEDATAHIVSVEDAVCDLDQSADVRMSAIEDAVCELDAAINGNGGGESNE